jgi:hypothetical protein
MLLPAQIDAAQGCGKVATHSRCGARPMLPWPPPPVTQATCPNPAPAPRLTALRAIFDWVYLTRPAEVWALPLRRQSEEVLRAALYAARCYRLPCKGLDFMACDPELHHAEFMTIAAMANVDVEDFVAEVHGLHPDDPFPASAFDPDARHGRSPPH